MNKKNYVLKEIIIFIIFGLLYGLLEILFRGYTHWTMVVLGGICGVLIGLLNEVTPTMKITLQMFISSLMVTALELVFGYILNIRLVLHIWDYSNQPFNFHGQICLLFSILWFFLSILVIYLDDYIKAKLFK